MLLLKGKDIKLALSCLEIIGHLLTSKAVGRERRLTQNAPCYMEIHDYFCLLQPPFLLKVITFVSTILTIINNKCVGTCI